MVDAGGPEQSLFKDEKMIFSISPCQLCSHTPSALNAGANRSGATCHMAMPQCCYLAKGAKRPSHTTNMISIFGLVQPEFIFGLKELKFIFGLVQPKFLFGLVNSRRENNIWKPISYASRFLTKFEMNEFQKRIIMVSCCGRHANYVTIVEIKRPMKCKKVVNSQSKAENSVLTGAIESNSGERNEYMNGVNKLIENRSTSQIAKTMQNASESKISKNCILANYEEDKHLQKMIKLVKSKDTAQIARLPVLWREKFTAFNLDSNNLLYMNERLVIPKNKQKNMMNAIHFGHTGKDAMLRDAGDVWWPKIHREVIGKASNCPQCRLEGKNLKSQKKFGDVVPPRVHLVENRTAPPPNTKALFSNKTISLIKEYYMKVTT